MEQYLTSQHIIVPPTILINPREGLCPGEYIRKFLHPFRSLHLILLPFLPLFVQHFTEHLQQTATCRPPLVRIKLDCMLPISQFISQSNLCLYQCIVMQISICLYTAKTSFHSSLSHSIFLRRCLFQCIILQSSLSYCIFLHNRVSHYIHLHNNISHCTHLHVYIYLTASSYTYTGICVSAVSIYTTIYLTAPISHHVH